MSEVLFSYFQNLSFRILRRKPFYFINYCICTFLRGCRIIATYLCIICRHFCCLMSLVGILPFTCTDKAIVYFYWQIADEGQSFESTVKAMQSHARPRNCQFSKTSTGILTKLILKALYGDYFSRVKQGGTSDMMDSYVGMCPCETV